MALSAAERSARARVAALARAAKYGPEVTRKATEARMRGYLHEVDPDGVLPQPERERRALAARRRDMARLSYLALRAKRRRLGLPVEDDEPDDDERRTLNPDDSAVIG